MTGELQGKKIVITGVTGQVAGPVAKALAKDNDVYGAARFNNADAKAALEADGVTCVRIDLAAGDVGALPADADYVLNFAIQKSNQWDADLEGNGGGTARLMEHHQKATAFLHCSSAAVYQPCGDRDHRFTEDDHLGDNHRIWSFMETYSICKIVAEEFARYGSQRFNLPTTIARLNTPYGDAGGWPAMHLESIINGHPVPVHPKGPFAYNLIHEHDILGTIPKLLAAATVPATVVNWGGEAVTIEDWTKYMGELIGKDVQYVTTDQTIEGTGFDTSKLHSIGAKPEIGWQEGMRRMVRTMHPELLES